jgi:hypothetical protein
MIGQIPKQEQQEEEEKLNDHHLPRLEAKRFGESKYSMMNQ